MTSEHLADLPSESGAITVKICHRVKPDARAEYETWLKRIIHVAAQYPGHLGVHILRPTEGHNDYEIALRFASDVDAGRWLESAERKALVPVGRSMDVSLICINLIEACSERMAASSTKEIAMSDTPETSFLIKHKTSDTKGRYVVELNGAEAELTYSKAGDAMIIIDHTSVPDVMRGQKVGVALVAQAVEDVRALGKKIMPLCPFAKAQFARHPEWHDVLS